MSVRKELLEILGNGKSPVYNGVTYTKAEDIPSDAELSKGDKEKEEAARKNIKAELKRLAEELALLDEAPEAKTEKKADEKPEAKADAKVADKKEEVK
jgi:hypothetical protein